MFKPLFLAVMLVAVQISAAASAADPGHGKALAERWCASCHAIAPESRQATDVPPAFASIARRAGFDADKLAYFLLNPHPVMPPMALSRNDAADLAAYIASLRN